MTEQKPTTESLDDRIERWNATAPRTKAPLWYEQFTTDLIAERQRLIEKIKRYEALIDDFNTR